MFHEKPNPNECPHCGQVGTLREVALRHTWQPVSLDYADAGVLIPVEYDRFETGDDTERETYECSDCYAEWPSLSALAQEQRIVGALTDWRDFHETRAERLSDLLQAGRRDDDHELTANQGAANAYARALAILRGNGEA